MRDGEKGAEWGTPSPLAAIEAGQDGPISPRNTEAQRSQGPNQVMIKPELENEPTQVPSCSQLIKSWTQVSWASSCPPPASPPPASPGPCCLQLMKVLLHKAARYVLSLFQLFICLLGCSFPLVSATLL